MSLNELTIAEARDRLRAREITAAELTDACLSAVDGAGALNAFVHHTPEIARQQAAAADRRLASGDAPGRLAVTTITGKSMPGSAAIGRKRIATRPHSMRPIDSSTVATGRRMKGAERFIRPAPGRAGRRGSLSGAGPSAAGGVRARGRSPAWCRA